ncbi:DUF2326 domain-containing protein [Candidatus Omnitrophota bacterium]
MLEKIYSNTSLLLKPVVFHAGINIILGRDSRETRAVGINGIGKSSLVRLIDYAFLSDSAQKIFFQDKYDFLREENHDIVLEFSFKNRKYFIRREFKKNSLIGFGDKPDELEDYTIKELKSVLTNIFFPSTNNKVFFEGNRFRTLMDFFIKDDLESQKRFDPLNFLRFNAKAKEKSIYNFYLLNLPTNNLIIFNELSTEHDAFTKTINSLETKLKVDTGKSIEEFRSEKLNIEKGIMVLEESLAKYEFATLYKNIEQKLIELTSQINSKLDEYHLHSRKLSKIKEGYDFNVSVDTQEIKKLYNEMLFSFGDLVAKTIDDVLLFKKEIVDNRNKFLIEKEKKITEKIQLILNNISDLEKERSKFYRLLEEKGALESITNTYEQLISEKTSLENNVQIVKQVDEIQEMISNLNVSISEIQRDISVELKKFENEINSLRTLFLDLLKHAIFLDEVYDDSYFDISLSSTYNRKQLPFKIDVKIPRVEALGQARLKIVAYDLMVFLHNIKNNRLLPDFLIHDGVFHGISPKTLINTINFMYHKFLEYSSIASFQYILTFNENEILVDQQYGKFDFDINNQIVADYADIPEKMIFKRILK